MHNLLTRQQPRQGARSRDSPYGEGGGDDISDLKCPTSHPPQSHPPPSPTHPRPRQPKGCRGCLLEGSDEAQRTRRSTSRVSCLRLRHASAMSVYGRYLSITLSPKPQAPGDSGLIQMTFFALEWTSRRHHARGSL